MVVAGLLGYFAFGLLPVTYKAQANLILRDPSAPGAFIDSSGRSPDPAVYLARQADVVNSQLVLSRVARALGGGWSVQSVRDSLDAQPSASSAAIQIQAQAGDPASAATLANSVGEVYQQVVSERVAEQAQDAIASLEQLRDRLQAQLDNTSSGQRVPQAARDALVSQIIQLQQQEQEVSVRAAAFGSGVELFDRAERPTSPAGPPRALAAVLGAVLGLVAAGVWAWWWAARDRRARSARDPATVLEAPLLAEIPRFPTPRDSDVTSLASVGPAAAEAYHFAVAAVERALAALGGQSLALTSASPGEGKTTTALLMAVAANHEHRRVLLIDADERTKRLTRLCDRPGAPELVDLRIDYDSSADDPEREPGPLPAELARLHPSGYFRTNAFRKLLLAVSELADLVLIDTPPVLAVAEAVAVAEQADGVAVVVRQGTSLGQLQALRQRLLFTGTPLIGYLFTQSSSMSGPYAAEYAQRRSADGNGRGRLFRRRRVDQQQAYDLPRKAP
jgi:Mrp family chromosome partitioning ATPase